uniref:Uncharacterized protein n=1 Tax=Setaria italica TaxID=4555 RepID=A0A0Q3PJ43_SETIT
MMPLLRPAA